MRLFQTVQKVATRQTNFNIKAKNYFIERARTLLQKINI
jgi:hypothetical protein